MTFGEKLQYLRKAKGMSQEELAGKVTVSRQAVSKWELNAAMPDTENIIQLSRLFNVTTDYLLKNTVEDEAPENSGLKAQADKLLDTPPAKHKNHIMQNILIVLAIFMVAFAIAVMTRPILLPFFAMIATAISIVTIIILKKTGADYYN